MGPPFYLLPFFSAGSVLTAEAWNYNLHHNTRNELFSSFPTHRDRAVAFRRRAGRYNLEVGTGILIVERNFPAWGGKYFLR